MLLNDIKFFSLRASKANKSVQGPQPKDKTFNLLTFCMPEHL